MMKPALAGRSDLALLASLFLAAGAVAQPAGVATYKQPPEAIRRVLDTPPPPGVSLSPDGSHLMLLHRRSLAPVADLSAPMLKLGG
jgi:hypothetical protein